MKIQCNHFELWDEVEIPRPKDVEEGEPWKPGDVRTTKKESAKGFVKGPLSCRFYVLETDKDGGLTGLRWKVHVDGPVDFKKVKAEFKDKGQDVSEADLKAAYGE